MRNDDILLGIYRHYKGGVYEVQSIAKHSETLEPLVIYRALNASEDVWARPAGMWNEEVIVDGKPQPRFAFIAGDIANMDGLPLFSIIEGVSEAMQTHAEEMSSHFHLPTGEVIYILADGMRAVSDGDDIDDSDRPAWIREERQKAMHLAAHDDEYLPILYADSSDQYEIMESFIDETPLLPLARERLMEAIQGKGAFKRFRNALEKMNLEERWYAHRDAAYRRMAREWCDAHGIKWGLKLISQKREV